VTAQKVGSRIDHWSVSTYGLEYLAVIFRVAAVSRKSIADIIGKGRTNLNGEHIAAPPSRFAGETGIIGLARGRKHCQVVLKCSAIETLDRLGFQRQRWSGSVFRIPGEFARLAASSTGGGRIIGCHAHIIRTGKTRKALGLVRIPRIYCARERGVVTGAPL